MARPREAYVPLPADTVIGKNGETLVQVRENIVRISSELYDPVRVANFRAWLRESVVRPA